MKKVVILIGSYCYNKGSEALVKGTIEIVKRNIPDSEIVLSSGEEVFSKDLNIPGVDRYVRRQSYYSGMSFNRIMANIYSKVLHNKKAADKVKYKNLIKECENADLVIVLGGDNYDKSYHMFDLMHSVNQLIKDTSKAKMVMYDVSLAADEIDEDIKNDFALFHAVTAREKCSLDCLQKELLQTVYYFPDPAFVMKSKEIVLPEKLIPNDTIGVNVSSMVTESKYGGGYDVVFEAYVKMIEWMIHNTPHNIMLIPHVMRNLDLKVLRPIYEYFKECDRVFLIDNENLNAQELKFLISQCRLYVGARTHSTIASYSSCVPTLVLGYSVKSIGIARDLFGSEEGYVISVKNLDNKNTLAKAFENLYNNCDSIKMHLTNIMPQYIELAWQAGNVFGELVNKEI